MTKSLLKALIILLLILTGCTSKDRQKNKNETRDTSLNNTTSKENTKRITNLGYFQLQGDSVIIPFFEIEVDLSTKATQKLKSDKETIIVFAIFSGQPKDTTSEEYIENGEIFVASSRRELTNSRIARFEGVKFSKAIYDSLADKDIQLLVNVFSGRKSFSVNLLNCNIVSERMSNVKGKRFTISGKLIYGDD